MGDPVIDKEKLLSFYYGMLRIRVVEEAIADRYYEQEMRCPVHLSIGQEAVAVGLTAALKPEDYVMSTHRSHAHYIAKGGSLGEMMAEIYGKAMGCSAGKGGSMHLIDLSVNFLGATPIVGSIIPVGVGAAFASYMQGEDRVMVVFFGDAATEGGVFSESLNFAALKSLPVIFVCENNLYSVYSHLSVRQAPGRNRVGIAASHGISAHKGNGNDVLAVYNLAQEAVQRARRGDGPTYLEFDTYRWREHCGPNYDNDLGYRTEEEFLSWRRRCPLENYEAYLTEKGILTKENIEHMMDEINTEINEAFSFATGSPFPELTELLKDIYSEDSYGPKD